MAYGKEIFEVRPDGVYVEYEGVGKFFGVGNAEPNIAQNAAEKYLEFLKRFADPILSIGAIQNTLNHFGYLIDQIRPSLTPPGLRPVTVEFVLLGHRSTIGFRFGSLLITVNENGLFNVEKIIDQYNKKTVTICVKMPLRSTVDLILHSEDNKEEEPKPVPLHLNENNRQFLNDEFRRLI